jgi:hypothetical protein
MGNYFGGALAYIYIKLESIYRGIKAGQIKETNNVVGNIKQMVLANGKNIPHNSIVYYSQYYIFRYLLLPELI